MTTRRSFLSTLGMLGLTLVAPLGRALGLYQGVRLYVNGIPLELPDKLYIQLDVPASGAAMGPVHLEITGGVLRVAGTDDESALAVTSKDNGGLRLDAGGQHCILIENRDVQYPPHSKNHDMASTSLVEPLGYGVPTIELRTSKSQGLPVERARD